MPFDLEYMLISYARSNSNKWYAFWSILFIFRNKLLHFITFPAVLWCFFVWMSKFRLIFIFNLIPFNVSFASGLVYVLYCFLLEPVAGILVAPVVFTIVYYASWFELLNKNALWVSLALFGACFASISMGTWLLEARHNEPRSSVLFRVFQLILVGTFFSFLEVLFFVGYRPVLREKIANKRS